MRLGARIRARSRFRLTRGKKMCKAWIPIDGEEYDELWDAFYEKFAFRPSVKSAEWPGIQEPLDSRTFSIRSFWQLSSTKFDRQEKEMNSWGLSLLRNSVDGESDWLYVLDWQHTCYRFFPWKSFDLDEFGNWPVSFYPDGDYSIFLGKEFEWVIFGHPWEETICFIGQCVLDELEKGTPEVLGREIRRGGKS